MGQGITSYSNSNNIYLTIDESGKIATYAYGKTKEGYHTSSTTVPLNQWTHIAAVWNNATGIHRIYMNESILDYSIYLTVYQLLYFIRI